MNILQMQQFIYYYRAFQLKSTAGRTPVSRVIRPAAWIKNKGSFIDFLKNLTIELDHISNSSALIQPKYCDIQ